MSAASDDVPGWVYRLYDKDGALLYIGSSANVGSRIRQHLTKLWWPEVVAIEADRYESTADACEAEKRAIQQQAPRFNKTGQSPAMASVVAQEQFHHLQRLWRKRSVGAS